MTFKELREAANMNVAEMARYFNIPYRTANKWDTGEREPASYLIELMQYKLDQEQIIKK